MSGVSMSNEIKYDGKQQLSVPEKYKNLLNYVYMEDNAKVIELLKSYTDDELFETHVNFNCGAMRHLSIIGIVYTYGLYKVFRDYLIGRFGIQAMRDHINFYYKNVSAYGLNHLLTMTYCGLFDDKSDAIKILCSCIMSVDNTHLLGEVKLALKYIGVSEVVINRIARIFRSELKIYLMSCDYKDIDEIITHSIDNSLKPLESLELKDKGGSRRSIFYNNIQRRISELLLNDSNITEIKCIDEDELNSIDEKSFDEYLRRFQDIYLQIDDNNECVDYKHIFFEMVMRSVRTHNDDNICAKIFDKISISFEKDIMYDDQTFLKFVIQWRRYPLIKHMVHRYSKDVKFASYLKECRDYSVKYCYWADDIEKMSNALSLE